MASHGRGSREEWISWNMPVVSVPVVGVSAGDVALINLVLTGVALVGVTAWKGYWWC
jgi:hypothetical protein